MLIFKAHSSGVSTTGRTKSAANWTGGAGDGDWSDSSNWSKSLAGFDRLAISATTDAITSSLDISGDVYDWIRFGPGFTGTTDSNVAASARILSINKPFGGAMTLAGTFDYVYVLDAPAEGLTFTGSTVIKRGLYIWGARGTVTINDSATVQAIYCTPWLGNQILVDAGATIDADTGNTGAFSRIDTVYVGGGARIESETGADLTLVAGGTFQNDGGQANQVDVYGGSRRGRYHLKASQINSPGVTLYSKGDLLLHEYDGGASAATIQSVSMYPGSLCDLRSGADHASITADITYWGGKFLVDGGRTVAP